MQALLIIVCQLHQWSPLGSHPCECRGLFCGGETPLSVHKNVNRDFPNTRSGQYTLVLRSQHSCVEPQSVAKWGNPDITQRRQLLPSLG